MRLADEVTSQAFGRMIDTGAERGVAFARKLAVDLGVGAALGIVSGLVALAIQQVMREPFLPGLYIAASVAATVLALASMGAFLPIVLHRKDGTWRASSGFVTALMSTGGIALFMGLAILLRAAGK